MQGRYVNDEEYRINIKMFCALSFCKVEDIRLRYDILAEKFLNDFGDSDSHLNFLQYIETTWVGRPHRNPRYSIEMWNSKEMSELHLPRTTNSVESWHKVLQNTCRFQHPTIFKLLDAFLLENVRINAICVRLENGEQVSIYSKRQYQLSNQRLLNIITTYNGHDPIPYLSACSNYIAF